MMTESQSKGKISLSNPSEKVSHLCHPEHATFLLPPSTMVCRGSQTRRRDVRREPQTNPASKGSPLDTDKRETWVDEVTTEEDINGDLRRWSDLPKAQPGDWSGWAERTIDDGVSLLRRELDASVGADSCGKGPALNPVQTSGGSPKS